jgi:hypothetical protein
MEALSVTQQRRRNNNRQAAKTSCHHGDYLRPNSLEETRAVLQRYPEIAIVEIDFVLLCEPEPVLLSSHDYEQQSVERGATLEEWVKLVVLEQKRLLWMDIKTRLGFWSLLSEPEKRLDVALLLALMRKMRRHFLKHCGQDVQQRVLLGCQDEPVYKALLALNNQEKHPWRVLLDLPFATSYIGQMLLPDEWINNWMQETYVQYPYEQDGAVGQQYVCLDRNFFTNNRQLEDFIQCSGIARNSVVIVYSYPRTAKPLRVPGYQIMMQCDYTT